MEIRIYNKDQKQKLLLLPPKYSSAKVFELLIPYLKDYKVFVISYDGFEGQEDKVYPGAEAEAEKIAGRLKEYAPFDLVYGHGIGVKVAAHLPNDFSKRYIYAGFGIDQTAATKAMLNMIMPKKQYKLLKRIHEPVGNNEISDILGSKMPHRFWKEIVPENIQEESVSRQYEDQLEIMDNLGDLEKQKKTLVLYGELQNFPLEKLKNDFPNLSFKKLDEMGRDEILLNVKVFKECINREMEKQKS